mgnify:CR=1 FL=1
MAPPLFGPLVGQLYHHCLPGCLSVLILPLQLDVIQLGDEPGRAFSFIGEYSLLGFIRLCPLLLVKQRN